MALVVELRCVEYLVGKYDRVVSLTFRGKHITSLYSSVNQSINPELLKWSK